MNFFFLPFSSHPIHHKQFRLWTTFQRFQMITNRKCVYFNYHSYVAQLEQFNQNIFVYSSFKNDDKSLKTKHTTILEMPLSETDPQIPFEITCENFKNSVQFCQTEALEATIPEWVRPNMRFACVEANSFFLVKWQSVTMAKSVDCKLHFHSTIRLSLWALNGIQRLG